MMYLRQNINQLKVLFPQEIANYQSCTMELTEKREKFEEYHSKTINQLKMHLEEVDESNYENNKAKVVNSTVGAGAGSVVLASAFVPVLWPVALGSFAVTAATAISGYMQEKDIKKWEKESMDKLKALHESFRIEVSDVSQDVKRIQECVFEILLLFVENIFCEFEDCLVLRTCGDFQQAGIQVEDFESVLNNDLVDEETRELHCESSLMSSTETQQLNVDHDMRNKELLRQLQADEMCETDDAKLSTDQDKVYENTQADNREQKCNESLEDKESHVHCSSGENSAETTVQHIATLNKLVKTCNTEDTEVEDKVQKNTTSVAQESTGTNWRSISEAGQAVKQTYDDVRASISEKVGPLGVITMDSISTVVTAEATEAGKEVAKKLYGNAGAIGSKTWCKLRNQMTTDASNMGGKLYLGSSALKTTVTQGRLGSSVVKSGGMVAESFGTEGGSLITHAASKKGGLVAAHAVGKKGSLLAAHTVGRHGGTLAAKTVGRLGHLTLFAGAGLAIWTVGMDVHTAVSAALEIAGDNKHGLHHAIRNVIEIMENEKKKMDKLFNECEKLMEDEIFYQFCKDCAN